MALNTTQTSARPATRASSTRPAARRGTAQARRPRPEPPGRPTWHLEALLAGTQPRRSSSAGEVVLAYLRQQARTMMSLEPMVRADEFDSVHQMRVATRRLRATLRSFGIVIPCSDTDHLAGELKWLGGLLGAARDAEVLPAHLQASLRPVPAELLIGPVQARVQGHFAPLRASAREEVIEAFGSPRYAALLTELDRLVTGPLPGPQAAAPARDVLPAAVERAYRQTRKRMRRARRAPRGQARDLALHQARKSAKRARYAAEAASPAIGKPARKFAGQMKKVQTVIGDHQDTVIARQAARDLGIGAHLAGENAFTYGLLYEHERYQAARLRRRARTTWRRASRPRHRKWMN